MSLDSKPKDRVLGLTGVAAFLGLCCGAGTVVGVAGLGGLLALATTPWVLVPTAIAVGGLVVWYRHRRACRVSEYPSGRQ